MDAANKRDLIKLGTPKPQLHLMRSFDPTLKTPQDVPDPYYGGDGGFEQVYQMLLLACEGLLCSIKGPASTVPDPQSHP